MVSFPRVLLVALAAGLCLASAAQPQQQGGAQPPQPQPQPVPAAGGAPDCRAMCTHYLGCHGTSDEASIASCVDACGGMDPNQVATLQQSTCEQILQVPQGGGGGGGGGQPSCGQVQCQTNRDCPPACGACSEWSKTCLAF